jgi:hypothetical protein
MKALFRNEWRVCTRSWLFLLYVLGLTLGLGLSGWLEIQDCHRLRARAEQMRALQASPMRPAEPEEIYESREFLAFISPDRCVPGSVLPDFHGMAVLIRPDGVPWLYQDPAAGETGLYRLSYTRALTVLGSCLGLLLGLGGVVLPRQAGVLKMVLGAGTSPDALWWSHWLARVGVAMGGYLGAMTVGTALVLIGSKEGWKALGPWLGTVLGGSVYAAVWVTIGMAISAWHRRWETALLTGLVVWSGLLWVVPRVAMTVAYGLTERPSEVALLDDEKAALNQARMAIFRTTLEQTPPSCAPPDRPMDPAEQARRMQACIEEMSRLARQVEREKMGDYADTLRRLYEDYVGRWGRWWTLATWGAAASPAFVWESLMGRWQGASFTALQAYLFRLWTFQRRFLRAGGESPPDVPTWSGEGSWPTGWFGGLLVHMVVWALVGWRTFRQAEWA